MCVLRRNKLIQVWNSLWESKWQNLHFWVNEPVWVTFFATKNTITQFQKLPCSKNSEHSITYLTTFISMTNLALILGLWQKNNAHDLSECFRCLRLFYYSYQKKAGAHFVMLYWSWNICICWLFWQYLT